MMHTDVDRASGNRFQLGDLLIDTDRQAVTKDGVEIALPRLSYELLMALVRVHPRMLSTDELMTSVWAPAVVNPETVGQRVKLLRQALGDDPRSPLYIEGVRGRGYRLIGPVTPVPALPPPPQTQDPQRDPPAALPAGAAAAPSAAPANAPAVSAAPLAFPRPRRPRRPILIGVGIVVLAGVAVAFWHWRLAGREVKLHDAVMPGISALSPGVPPSDKSIVVLPFLDLSEHKDQGYFADGMTEEVTSLLSQVSDLRVSARTSAFYYKDRSVPVEQIGGTLGVANVLEGSLRKSGDRLRITVQLIRTDSGYHLWSESYDRKPGDVFATQTEIAREVVRALKASLDGDHAFRETLTTNPEARRLYLQAVWQELAGTSQGNKNAIDILQRAVAVDPNFAAAWAKLSGARAGAIIGVEGLAPEAVRPGAYEAAERALTLDPQLADAHVALANILLNFDWNSIGALAEVQRALALDANNTGALQMASGLQLNSGHFAEAERLARDLVSREPLNPANYFLLAHVLWFAGKVPEAIRDYQAVIDSGPAWSWPRLELGLVRLSAGDAAGALAEVNQGKEPDLRQILRPMMLDAVGQHAQAEQEEAAAEKKYGVIAAYGFAAFYTLRGNADRATAWLERDYRNHDGQLLTIKFDPMFRKLRPDPRFQALVQKLHLPD